MAMEAVDESIVDFKIEAQRSLEEVSFAIKHGALSTALTSTTDYAYMNLTTFEGASYTIRLCMNGFQVVGKQHDCKDLEDDSDKNTEPIFETVYALLHYLSPSYQHNFHHAVSDKLQKVKANCSD